jgi:hypothetical protein
MFVRPVDAKKGVGSLNQAWSLKQALRAAVCTTDREHVVWIAGPIISPSVPVAADAKKGVGSLNQAWSLKQALRAAVCTADREHVVWIAGPIISPSVPVAGRTSVWRLRAARPTS